MRRYAPRIVLLFVGLISPAVATQDKDENKDEVQDISASISEASLASLKLADKRLVESDVAVADRAELRVLWLDAVQTKVTELHVADQLLVSFFKALPTSTLPIDQQKSFVRSWVSNECVVQRAGRSDSAFRTYVQKIGLAHITWCASLEAKIDPKFDPDKLIQLNVEPPAGSMILPGIEPASIPDEQLREEYSKLVRENAEYAKYYRAQSLMRLHCDDAAKSLSQWLSTLGAEDVKLLKRKAQQAKLSQRTIEILFPNKANP